MSSSFKDNVLFVHIAVLGTGFFLGVLATCSHFSMLWVWTVMRLLETVDVHSGYDLPWVNPMHLLPGYGGQLTLSYNNKIVIILMDSYAIISHKNTCLISICMQVKLKLKRLLYYIYYI